MAARRASFGSYRRDVRKRCEGEERFAVGRKSLSCSFYEAGVSRSYLSQLERAPAFYASLKILEKLAKTLRVEPYELIVPPPKKRR
jgi:hypothetical protein